MPAPNIALFVEGFLSLQQGKGVSWEPGEDVHLTFMAISPNAGGDAEETVVFRRQ